MIICRVPDRIRIKNPNRIRYILPGDIFETSNIGSAISLLKHKKVEIISSDNESLHVKQSPQCRQCPQCPQSPQSEYSRQFRDADIEKEKSAMSANDQWNHSPRGLSKGGSDVSEWDVETQRYLEWFRTAPRMKRPFHLETHLYVSLPPGFYDSIERSIRAGPSGPRGKNGALLDDLKKLRRVIDGDNLL